MTDRVRVLIADDEALARGYLRSLLKKCERVEVVGEVESGTDAVAAIRRHDPELVFLDIQMPELDGFGVIQEVGPSRMPIVVFVTAYDQYAIKAFDVHAIDYLLKPFDEERFQTALARALEELRQSAQRVAPGDRSRLDALLEYVEAQRKYLDRIPLKDDGRIRFVEVGRVDWIEADGKAVKIHCGKDAYSVRDTLAHVLDHLDPRMFIRVHRSIVVNATRVQEVHPWFHGDFLLVLSGGARITTGRSYRSDVRREFDPL